MQPQPIDLTALAGGPAPGAIIADLAGLLPDQAALATIAGLAIFIQPRGTGAVAYVNSCPHIGLPLDLKPGTMYNPDVGYFICSTHGALFGPDTGLCVGGPCAGRHLQSVAIVRDGTLVRAVQLPEKRASSIGPSG
jgi:nitrite reductase/ring-hydroxylating ferredoxin subunit